MSVFPALPDISALTEKRREFSEERILGYTPDKVYDVVADLNRYIQSCHYLRVDCTIYGCIVQLQGLPAMVSGVSVCS